MKKVISIFLIVLLISYAGIYVSRNFNFSNKKDEIDSVQAETDEVMNSVKEYEDLINSLSKQQQAFLDYMQEYISKSSDYKSELSRLISLLNDLSNPTSEEYKELQSEIEIVESNIKSLQSEFNNYIEANNISDSYGDLIEDYNSLTVSALKLNEVYKRLLVLLNVDDTSIKSDSLQEIELSINAIYLMLENVRSSLDSINNNNNIIDTIRAKVTKGNYNSHLVIVNYEYTDDFFTNYILPMWNKISSRGSTPFLGLSLTSLDLNYDGSSFTTNSTDFYYFKSVHSSTTRFLPVTNEKVTSCILLDDLDLVNGYTTFEFTLCKYGIDDFDLIHGDLPAYIETSNLYKSKGSLLDGVYLYNYGYLSCKLKLSLTEALPDIINIDVSNSVYTSDDTQEVGARYSYSITSYNFN